jgi:beta-glucosidase
MMTGSPVSMEPFSGRADAILQAWYPGQFGGVVIAETLLGLSNPSGRLPVTFYKQDSALPDFMDYSMDGRTYKFLSSEPVYPFGYGLSYTSFHYSGLSLSSDIIPAGESVHAAITVRNTGKMDGAEVVQLYLKDMEASTRVPHWQLAAFCRVELKAGEERELAFEIPAKRMCVINEDGKAILEPGIFTIFAGGGQPDSVSVALTGSKPLEISFEVTGEAREIPI